MAASKRLRFSLQKKFILSIVLVVIPILGLTFAWTALRNKQNTIDQVINQARVLSRQIILTRQWISDCGGVLVDRESEGAKPYRYFFDDRLQTGRGTYNRFTPSMVTKKLSQYSLRENLYHFRLAGLNPMNPDNSPDAFERMALLSFVHKQSEEVYTFGEGENGQVFRYTVPLYVDTACLECHRNFDAGRVAGCLSIFLPSQHVENTLRVSQSRLIYSGIALILLTILTLFFTLRHVVIKPVNQLKSMADEMKNGNLHARLDLKTNDEFERLGNSFNNMVEKLARNREIMEEKVERATQELSEANCELQKLDKLKTDFITDMSHELRSPVTSIKGGLDYLKRTTVDKESKSYLSLIDNNLLRLTCLVNDMLDLTRIEAGKVTWNFETYDMTALILEIVELLNLKAGSRGLTLIFNSHAPLWVKMDIERIEQVLVNLIENAIKFSPEQGEIIIESRMADGWCLVSVADSGIGIPKEETSRIFTKFHTLPSGDKRARFKGTGLGLTICKKIITAHKGEIWAESEPGRGAVFFFKIPLVPEV